MAEKLINVRDLIKKENENKCQHCSNTSYECSLPKVDGYDYCIRHILKGSRGDFCQCNFTYSNGRRCFNSLKKYDLTEDPTLSTYCYEHSRQFQLRKAHLTAEKFHHLETNEVLLKNLRHHIKPEKIQENIQDSEQDEEIDVVTPDSTPFNLQEQVLGFNHVKSNQRNQRKGYAAEDALENEIPTCSNTTYGFDFEESDASIDSDEDDPLKHAGVYTSEEVIRIAFYKCNKLIELYEDQQVFLQNKYKECRRQYLADLRKERETLCSINDQMKESVKDQEAYKELKAFNSYHRRHGQEAVLYKRFKEKRNRLNEKHNHKGPGFMKCMHSEGGVKCGERVIPCTKHCRKHILEDKRQILYEACNVEKSGIVCQEPVPCIFEETHCILHMTMPPNKIFIPRKFDSDSDEEGSPPTVVIPTVVTPTVVTPTVVKHKCASADEETPKKKAKTENVKMKPKVITEVQDSAKKMHAFFEEGNKKKEDPEAKALI